MSNFLFHSLEERNYQSTNFPEPRDFQKTAHEALRQGNKAGHKNQCLMAPTGAGKTYLGLRIAAEALKRGKRAVFACDRTTLIDQTSQVADSYGLGAHGIIQANHWRTNKRMPFQIASVQTLARREWPESDVIIIDECHTLYKGWTEHVKNCNAAVIGLSATPFSKGMGLIFSNLVNAATMDELTKSGVLVPMRIMSCTKINMNGAETSSGEWSETVAGERGLEIVGDVVSEWQVNAEGKKTIVFGATVKHCEEMARQFNDAGINAAVFSCHTKSGEREVLLNEYRKHDSELRVLISVEALAKGFDVKDVECVCDCRPLRKSLSIAIQMWGRGLRASPETGKKECLLLDFSGNIMRFADDYSDIFFNGLDSLDSGEKLDKAIRKDDAKEKEECSCPACGQIQFGKKCTWCGYERKTQSLIEHLPGRMQEVLIGKTVAAASERDLWNQLCTYARSHSAPERQAGRAAHLYKDIMGVYPNYSFESAIDVPISRAVMGKIRSRNIAFSKRRVAWAPYLKRLLANGLAYLISLALINPS
jgi:DNA repair protein RadD